MSVGDVVFSYANGEISAVGRVTDASIDAPKPEEFGAAGAGWNDLGYLVRVDFSTLLTTLHPKSYIDTLAPLLPEKYSPIRADGGGNQKCYLAHISRRMAYTLLDLIGIDSITLVNAIGSDDLQIQRGMSPYDRRPTITEREQLVLSRRGQGVFRRNVFQIERACRVSGITDLRLLKASHIKPWASSNNQERLDGNNGLLLTPHIDHLFDRGYVSFADDGAVLTNAEIDPEVLAKWDITNGINVGQFNDLQKFYLQFHRENIFRW